MNAVRQAPKHQTKRRDNDFKITLMSPLFISIKKINLLLLSFSSSMTNTILKSVGYLSVGNASERCLLITNSTYTKNHTLP